MPLCTAYSNSHVYYYAVILILNVTSMNAMYNHSSLFMMVQGGVELTGYLMKMSRRLHSWRQLWCVLKGAQLFYYSSEVTLFVC
jgi:hypothetical protein